MDNFYSCFAFISGKLKALSKNKDEKEFGSGSDISDISRASISRYYLLRAIVWFAHRLELLE